MKKGSVNYVLKKKVYYIKNPKQKNKKKVISLKMNFSVTNVLFIANDAILNNVSNAKKVTCSQKMASAAFMNAMKGTSKTSTKSDASPVLLTA